MLTEWRPFLFQKNRVRRTYLGGKLIDCWQGVNGTEDRYFPEEWIGSVVDAIGFYKEKIPDEGQSFVELGDGCIIKFKDLIHENPEAVLGRGHVQKYGESTALLVKMLDSAQKLSIQVHPDRIQSKRLFHSPFGKTESWYVIETRVIDGQEPYMLLGFKEGITREKWERMFFEQDLKGLFNALQKVPIRPGEMYLVEGGIPHAIGPGCFVAEIQEPTDYTMTVERANCKTLYRTDEMCHMGVGMEGMFDCFHYTGMSLDEVYAKWRIPPQICGNSIQNKRTLLMNRTTIQYFGLERYDVQTDMEMVHGNTFSFLTVLSGNGKIRYNDKEYAVFQGESFLIPAVCEHVYLIASDAKKPFVCINSLPPL